MAYQTLNRIRKLIGYPDKHWQALCLPLIQGISRDDLQYIRKIMTVRQSFYLPPGAAAEDIYRDRDLWTYATLVVAIQKLGYPCEIPNMAQAWINHNALCTQTIQFAMASTPTGVLHEIVTHVLGETAHTDKSSERVSQQATEKVQTEQNEDHAHLGSMFIAWMIQQLNQGHIHMSQRGSIIHAIEDGFIIVSPKAFKQFNQDNYHAVLEDFLTQDVFVSTNDEYKWDAGNGIFIKGYLMRYDSISSNLSCDISINYELEQCL